jgi:trehalose utilization protein
MNSNRREFIKSSSAAASGLLLGKTLLSGGRPEKKIRILVWDERADTEKQAYDHFLGNYIAEQLGKDPQFSVRSAGLDDPEQGLSETVLNDTDVLFWWGHTRQQEISPEKGKSLVDRIHAGSLAFIALHSAHWSTPFVQAMDEITRRNALADHPGHATAIRFIIPQEQYTAPKYDTRVTPYTVERKFPDGQTKFEVHLPICCFPAYRNDGKPSTVQVLLPDHPIMKGLPSRFSIPQTEMYDEPFHVPPPDQVLFEECWAEGEWFRSGMLWELGQGKIFYFRPGHEAFPVYKDEKITRILLNAAKWMAS